MSSLVYPALAGITFPYSRVYEWKSSIKEAVSGKESAIQYRRYPKVRWEINYEFLRDNITVSDLKAIIGLHNALGGRYDTFLYTDPYFSSVTAESFGTGNGTTTAFQLIAKFQNSGGPGASERIQNFNGSPSIFKDGVPQTGGGVHYTLGPTGIVTFTSAPSAGQALTWTGLFYYRCRFLEDELIPIEFMRRVWEMPASFRSVPL